MTPSLGAVVTLADPVLAELLGAPFDVAWIDLEHGALGVGDVPALAAALSAAGCRAEVRLPSCASEALPPVLDAGVDGVVAPCVESAAEARAFAGRLRYPPAGTRGFGPRRAGGYGRADAPTPRCTVQIESVTGVAAAGEIAAVDGIDALVVGCADLTLALGAAADGTARLLDAVDEARAAARAHGIGFGIAGARGEALGALARGGVDLVVGSVDIRLYAGAADAAAAAAREAVA